MCTVCEKGLGLAMKSKGILFIWGFYLAWTLHTNNLDSDFWAISVTLAVFYNKTKIEFELNWNVRVESDLESTSQGLFKASALWEVV